MRATRTRIASVVEWLIAAVVVTGVAAAGSVTVREARTVRALTPVSAAEPAASEPPSDIPSRTVSLPVLLLADGKAIRVGDSLPEVLKRVGVAAQVGSGPGASSEGERFTRFYSYIGSRFALAFERARTDAQPRVVGIYVQ
jgi:hypothetical protein